MVGGWRRHQFLPTISNPGAIRLTHGPLMPGIINRDNFLQCSTNEIAPLYMGILLRCFADEVFLNRETDAVFKLQTDIGVTEVVDLHLSSNLKMVRRWKTRVFRSKVPS